MFRLSKKNKRAISTMIAYVLLISISLSLSVMVYSWLRFYVGEDEIPACDEGVNLIITKYVCVKNVDGYLLLDLKNKGRFNIDGFTVRVNDRVGSDFGIYTLNSTGSPMAVGEEVQVRYDFKDYSDIDDMITIVEVQPFIMDGEKINCQSSASQKVVCQS